jgi:hypothetical protein
MKLIVFLLVTLIASSGSAVDVLYLTALSNGTPTTLLVRKFERTSPTKPYVPKETAALPLSAAGSLTDLQFNGATELHVYYTQRQGNKARVVRETVNIASGINFVSGSTKRFPANLSNSVNFDTNDVNALVQKTNGSQLATRKVNPAGNIAGPFKRQPAFPFAPFGSHISEAKPFFIWALWAEGSSGRIGFTLQNLTPPVNARSFLFSGRVLNIDASIPLAETGSPLQARPEEDIVEMIFAYFEEDGPGAVISTVGSAQASRFTPFVRRISRSDFSPIGNVKRLDRPRSGPASSAYQFNGIDIEPLGTAIFYIRHNSRCGSNEVVIQTFNPKKDKKVGKAKVAFPCDRARVLYGLSSVNANFKNGSPVP